MSPLADTSATKFANWTIPVHEDTRVLSYEGVPAEERTGSVIVAEPDLVMGGDPEDERSLFYHPNDIGVDAKGHIYVLDAANFRIQVFDSAGLPFL